MFIKFKAYSLFTMLVASYSFAYDYSDNVPASKSAPGGLTPSQTPLFVSLGFDDNNYSGLPGSGGTGGMTWATDFFKNLKNPAGTGNLNTFDGTDARVTFFNTSTYIASWGSESNTYVKRSWRTAYTDGHEMANHTHQHLDGGNSSVAQWQAELQLSTEWQIKPWNPNETVGSPNNANGIGVPAEEIKGFRTPFLSYNNNLFAAVKAEGLTYGASIEDGWNADYDGTNGYFPHTLNNGSPVHRAMYQEGEFSYDITPQAGLWETGVPVMLIPDQAKSLEYGLSYNLRTKIKSNWSEFDLAKPKVGGMDYNLWVLAKLNKQEFVAVLKYNLDQRLAGNRAPMLLVTHSGEYSSKYNFPPNATTTERQEAIEEFIIYALTKPEVRIVPYIKVIDWMRNPVALGGVASSSQAPTSSETIASSSAESNLCEGIPAWQARTYDWVAQRESVVYNNTLYSHKNWVNATAPDQNSDWRNDGNCTTVEISSQTLSSVTVSSSIAPSSTPLSSSIAPSSTPLSSSIAPSSTPLSSSIAPSSTPLSSSIAPSSSTALSSSIAISSSSETSGAIALSVNCRLTGGATGVQPVGGNFGTTVSNGDQIFITADGAEHAATVTSASTWWLGFSWPTTYTGAGSLNAPCSIIPSNPAPTSFTKRKANKTIIDSNTEEIELEAIPSNQSNTVGNYAVYTINGHYLGTKNLEQVKALKQGTYLLQNKQGQTQLIQNK